MIDARWSRRRLLQAVGGAAATWSVGTLVGCGRSSSGAYVPSYRAVTELGQTGARLVSEYDLPPSFSQPMKLPKVADPLCGPGGLVSYALTAEEATQEILPGVGTRIWGYNGTYPGPTFSTERGQKAVVVLRNDLRVPIVRHLHGALTPSPSDGYPLDLILPRTGWKHPLGMAAMGGRISHGEKTYTYPLDQRAATLWYHDHRMDFTGPQVARGMVGMHLHRDDVEKELALPAGPYELPMVIADRSFGRDGSILYPSLDPTLTRTPGVLPAFDTGVLGDTILVNGRQAPYYEVEPTTYRLRLVNASNARHYRLTLDPAPASGTCFTVIGTDGGFLGAPAFYDSLLMAQAERYDVVVDFSRYPVGSAVVLRNLAGDGRQSEVMQFRVRGSASVKPWTAPARLADVARLDPAKAVRTRTFVFSQLPVKDSAVFTIAGMTFDPMVPAARVQQGDTEIWEFRSDLEHPVHVHNVHFQVINDPSHAWKDVVSLPSNGYARVVVPFTSYKGRYILHCHNLVHEDMGMMARYDIV